MSNGIGGASFLDGKLYYGADGCLGEYGMLIVEDDGRKLENYNYYGSAEMYASGRGIVSKYAELKSLDINTMNSMSAKRISELARTGDEYAIKAFERAGSCIGKVIASACNILNPEKVIIGGGLSLAFDCFSDAMYKTYSKEFLIVGDYSDIIELSPLGNLGGIMGACAVGMLGMRIEGEKFGYRGTVTHFKIEDNNY